MVVIATPLGVSRSSWSAHEAVPFFAWRVTSRALHASLPSRIGRRIDSMLPSLSLKAVVIAVALPVISLCPPIWGGGSPAMLTSAVAQPVATQTTTVSDPVGDPNFNAPAFQDV